MFKQNESVFMLLYLVPDVSFCKKDIPKLAYDHGLTRDLGT